MANQTNSTDNSTDISPWSRVRWYGVISLFYVSLFLILFSIVILASTPQLRKQTANILLQFKLVIDLVLSFIMVGICVFEVLFAKGHRWVIKQYRPIAVRAFIDWLEFVGRCATLFLTLLISLDRCVAVWRPRWHRKWTCRHALLLPIVAIGLSFALSIPLRMSQNIIGNEKVGFYLDPGINKQFHNIHRKINPLSSIIPLILIFLITTPTFIKFKFASPSPATEAKRMTDNLLWILVFSWGAKVPLLVFVFLQEGMEMGYWGKDGMEDWGAYVFRPFGPILGMTTNILSFGLLCRGALFAERANSFFRR